MSRFHPGVIWTHNDGGHSPTLFAVDSEGVLLGRVHLLGVTNRDWEDIETAPCARGTCLYVGDTGDNAHAREQVAVYRIPEPDPVDSSVTGVEVVYGRLPFGARDVEAMFVLPNERIHLVTKGSRNPVEIYRFPSDVRFLEAERAADDPGPAVATLELIQVLDDSRRSLPRQVTGAAASPSGDQVVVRTYETLEFFRVDGGHLLPARDNPVNLRSLREGQGEGVGWGFENRIALTSEAGPFGTAGSIAALECRVDPIR